MGSQRVGIVGAGVAGLRCASVLCKRPGTHVTILEGRNRLGGRVAQDDSLGKAVDIGANWIHDVVVTADGCSNPITALASETNTLIHRWNDRTMVFDSNGQLVPEDVSKKAMAALWEIFDRGAAFSQEHMHDEAIGPNESLADYIQAEVSRTLDGETNEEKLLRSLVLGLSEMWGAYIGEAAHTQSLRLYGWEACDEEDCFLAPNYARILARIAQPALEGGVDVQKNQNVVAIRGRADTHDAVQIEVEDGSSLESDDVVLTCPLGWLKKHAATAIEPLSPVLAKAISSVSFGRLDKIFVKFPTAFWDQEGRDPFSFMHWIPPRHEGMQTSRSWKFEAVSLAAQPQPHAQSVLLFYVFGDCSTHVASRLHGKSRIESEAWLEDFLNPCFSRLPGYDAKRHRPTRLFATSWCTDKFSYGSYTTFQTGDNDGPEGIETMRHGMPEAGIWLAGEHTAPLGGLGSVYGAYVSGENVALRIIEGYEDTL